MAGLETIDRHAEPNPDWPVPRVTSAPTKFPVLPLPEPSSRGSGGLIESPQPHDGGLAKWGRQWWRAALTVSNSQPNRPASSAERNRISRSPSHCQRLERVTQGEELVQEIRRVTYNPPLIVTPPQFGSIHNSARGGSNLYRQAAIRAASCSAGRPVLPKESECSTLDGRPAPRNLTIARPRDQRV